MSVFSTPPPNLSTEEAEDMIFDLYGLKTQATSLDSERDQNFLCTTPDNKQMVLKISNPAEDKTILEMQHECMKYIRANNAALQVPWMLVGDGENAIMEYDLQSTTYLVRLAHYLPGLLLTDVSQCGSMLHKLGAFLGHLSLAMRGFNHSAAHRDFPWDIAQTGFIETHKQYVNQHVETIDHFVELYRKIVLPNNTNLRKSVIHNDGNDHNVLANNDGEIVGIIDFGDMVYSFVACEPAVCMAYVALEKNDPLKSIAQVLKGFHEIFPLVDDELRSIIYLICIRCCITVTMAAYRKLLFPDNEYISVTENQAWDFLKTMQNKNLETCSRQLLTYAKS
ncbi:MAG: phosphotransferase [Chloroflexota bacterium]|nr:phosphotransferase [Chloroflexota bacterium]